MMRLKSHKMRVMKLKLILEAESRFNYADKIANQVVQHSVNFKKTLSDKVDKLILGSLTGCQYS
ncbi:hypothetical protein BSPWISOXPB_7626 [uncultured Gammaproteobacteria bacterium]|nr:hypothetical protein BSPWISOXPB_7626 [uncultured Gammaproteobacteria bacterium]